MNKRRPLIDASQLGFTFEPPMPARRDADLAGLDRMIAASVGVALKEDARSREEIAGAMSALLAEPVTKMMLDAYASEARGDHNISAARLLALVAATERYDLLDPMLRRIGAAVLVGEELHAARLGSLQAQKRALDAEIRKYQAAAQPITRGGTPR
jgi:hypothetical protein